MAANQNELPQVVQEKVLLTWSEKSRPFKRRSRELYVTLLSVVGLIGAIMFLIEGPMPAILLGALFFLFYVLSTVEPDKIDYQITNYGVKVAGKLTTWDRLGRFWFSERLGTNLLILETFAIPGRLELVIDAGVKNKIEENLKKYLVMEEIPPTILDKAANWASRKLPQS